MTELTILKRDSSLVDIILISDSLRDEILKNLEMFELDNFSLIFLKQMKNRTLTIVSRGIKSVNSEDIQDIASDYFNWFDELLEVINRLEELSDSESLIFSIFQ